jgi:hypothetical protein
MTKKPHILSFFCHVLTSIFIALGAHELSHEQKFKIGEIVFKLDIVDFRRLAKFVISIAVRMKNSVFNNVKTKFVSHIHACETSATETQCI